MPRRKQVRVVVENRERAGFVVRVAATFIDTIIIALLLFVLVLTTVLALIAPLAGWVYYVVLDVKIGGQTFGKKFFGIKVVADGRNDIDWGTAIMREVVGRFLSGFVFGLGFLWIIWDREKQGWLDKIARTHVVHTSPLSGVKQAIKWLLFALMILGPVIAAAAGFFVLMSIGSYINTKNRNVPTQEIQQEEVPMPSLNQS